MESHKQLEDARPIIVDGRWISIPYSLTHHASIVDARYVQAIGLRVLDAWRVGGAETVIKLGDGAEMTAPAEWYEQIAALVMGAS